MPDVIDFRVNDRLAVGHDPLNTIIFTPKSPGNATGVPFDGQRWKAVYFVYLDKAVLLRALRDFGWAGGPEMPGEIASMPSDLREYRATLVASQPAFKTAAMV